LVGVRGFEPPTSASQTLRASQLRYTPPLSEYSKEAVFGQTKRTIIEQAE
jgi:hypothetical protein